MSHRLPGCRQAVVKRSWLAIAMTATVVAASLPSATAAAEVITFEMDGAPALKVERNTPGVTPAAWELASSIKALDQRLKSSAAITATNDPELESATRLAVADLRSNALQSLELALDIQARTSGSLDATLMASASGSAGQALEVLRNPPQRLAVVTEITASLADTFLQYISTGALKLERGSWLSYNPGVRLRIGVYTFRVCAEAGGAELYREPVNVLYEPTKLTLNVPRKP